MMGKKRDISKQLSVVAFRCQECRHSFKKEPDRVDDDPDNPHHPWAYFAVCPECGEDAPQAHWEKSLLKGWANATGPISPAGKAASAANLDGHPTPEEALRTRFNAMKHGMNARTATFFPARPGKYGRCNTCDVDWGTCAGQPACVKQTEIFMLHHAAFEQRNPAHLTALNADLQASVMSIIQMIIQDIAADGVKLVSPEWTAWEGVVTIAKYIDPATGNQKIINKIEAHPLLKTLTDFLSKNGMSLSDMGMSMKSIQEEQSQLGRLKDVDDDRQSLMHFAAQTADSMNALKDMMAKSKARIDRDPVLLEYQQQNGDDGGG